MHAQRAWLRGLGVLMLVSVVWTKPGLTGQEWAVDRAVCEREAQERTSFHTGMARAKAWQCFLGVCLEATGYRAVTP